MIIRKKKRMTFTFEIVPINLIDLFLVILIFFITTTTFLRIKTINLDLPVSETAINPATINIVALNVRKDGKFFLDTREYEYENLIIRLKEIKTRKPATIFQLGADKKSLHADFITAMDALQNAGIEEISIVTKG